MDVPAQPLVRIGELSRRLGVSEYVLRAWERRYGLLRPVRSSGGFRLYSEDDEGRVRRMQVLMAQGLSAREAAAEAAGESVLVRTTAPPGVGAGDHLERLRRALNDGDEQAAQEALDGAFSELSVTSVLRDILIPYLGDLGERWARGEASIAQEHLASNVIRGRLAGLTRGWGAGRGPHAALACAPEDHHDLALLMFGVALNRRGWKITYLGPHTPVPDLIDIAEMVSPDLVVVSTSVSGNLEPHRKALAHLAHIAPLALAGPGVSRDLADRIGARHLSSDPVTEAHSVDDESRAAVPPAQIRKADR